LFGLAVLILSAGAAFAPEPNDWDPAYYRSVARSIAAGHGAVTAAVWNLSWTPPALPYPAALHWMPLPSRVLVPGVLMWPAHGDQVVTVLLGALWAPIAWALARVLGAAPRTALAAGLLAVTGLSYGTFLSTPDCVALYGVLGGLACLALAKGRWGILTLVGAAAALTRNDGFLFSPCLALGLRGWPALAVAVSGPLTAAAWHLRNYAIVGEPYLAIRAATANVVDTRDLLSLTLGDVEPLGFADRLAFVGTEGLWTALMIWLVVLPYPSIGLWWRRERWIRGIQAYWLAMPLVTQVLAPGVASSGSVFRSASALFPIAAALAATSLAALGAWSQQKRGYSPHFLPILLGGPLVALTLLLGGSQLLDSRERPSRVCDPLAAIPAGEAVLSVHPLLIEAHCARPAALLVRGMTAAQAADLAARFHIRYALSVDEDFAYAPAPRDRDMSLLLPGWVQVAPHLYLDPSYEARSNIR
jgi:hypothetical protein